MHFHSDRNSSSYPKAREWPSFHHKWGLTQIYWSTQELQILRKL